MIRSSKLSEIKFVKLNDGQMFIKRTSLIDLLRIDELTCLRGGDVKVKVTANYIRKLIERLEEIKEQK